MAMISTVTVIAIITGLALVIAGLGVANLRDSSLAQARVQAVDAAEAGIDVGYMALQSGGVCSIAGDLAVDSSSTAAYDVTVTYYDADNNELGCDPTIGVIGTPVNARILSTGRTEASQGGAAEDAEERTMESLVNLQAVLAGGDGPAIFSDSQITWSSNMTLYGDGSDNVTVYANGLVTCQSNAGIPGMVLAPWSGVEMQSNCVVAGNIHSRDSVVLKSNAQLGGSIVSSRGGADLDSNAKVSGDVTVAGDVTMKSNATVVGTVREQVAGIPDPKPYDLPVITSDTSTWVNAGFAPKNYSGGCKNPNINETGRVVLVSTCDFTWTSNKEIVLNEDLVVIAKSFSTKGNFKVRSADGEPKRLWFIVPHVDNSSPCTTTSGGITLASNSTFEDPVEVFFYTPNLFKASSNTRAYGQIYAGCIDGSSNFKLHYRPVGVPGMDLGGGPEVSTGNFKVDILYKRETVTP
ncbi:polymer-forming cytoskeletal protein [Kineosporiaceae bacterium SCSIO 59966]|nr:polymer-forming cytoskeletal protein [Kineosporiaceae bacterium SCSIO 59966]